MSAESIDREQLIEALHRLDDPESKKNAFVYRVWEDGEVTQEKAGHLLGSRTLFTVKPPTRGYLPPEAMPHTEDGHGFAWSGDEKAALSVRALFEAWAAEAESIEEVTA